MAEPKPPAPAPKQSKRAAEEAQRRDSYRPFVDGDYEAYLRRTRVRLGDDRKLNDPLSLAAEAMADGRKPRTRRQDLEAAYEAASRKAKE